MPDVYQRAYGKGSLFYRSVLDAEDSPAGLTLESAMTFAAADVQVISDEQGATNGAAESINFTSGSEKPLAGQQVSGDTSSATATVIGTVLTSGTWSGGTAAGRLFVESAGTFQSENLSNDTTGSANVMTIASDLDGFAAYPIGNSVVVALTSTELTCEQCSVEVVDATATEVWLEDQFAVETFGHPDALHQPEGNALVLADGTVGGTGNTTSVAHLAGLAWGDDELNDHLLMLKDVSSGEYHSRWVADWVNSTELATIDSNGPALPFTPVSGDLWWALSLRRDTTPAALGGQAQTDVVSAVDSATTVAQEATLDSLFGNVIADSINDASATATGFTVTTSVGADVRVGFLRLTSGTLAGEGRLVSWTGTTVTVLSDSSMPTALKQFSAAPANSVTFDFRPF